uniref:Anion exchange protein n=1 Tax=Caenorhabditis tropicalis TaxID=1561998 RepID=A0A1I7SXD9_9PELO
MSNASPGRHSNKGFSIGIEEESETSFDEPSSPPSHLLKKFLSNNDEQAPLILPRSGNRASNDSTLESGSPPPPEVQPHLTVDVYNFDDPFLWTQVSRFGRYESDCIGYDNHFGKPHVPCLQTAMYRDLQQLSQKAILLKNVPFESIDGFCRYLEKHVTDPDFPELGHLVSQLIAQRINSLSNQKERNKKKFMSTQSFVHHPNSQSDIRRNMISAPYNLEKMEHNPLAPKTSLPTSNSFVHLMNTVLRNPPRITSHPLGPDYDEQQEIGIVLSGSVENTSVCRMLIIRFAEAASMEMVFPGIKKVREIFFIVGPVLEKQSYIDMGRALASVASNPATIKTFERLKSPESITRTIERFLGETAVIAPGRIENKSLVSSEVICKVVNMEFDKKEKVTPRSVHHKVVDVEKNSPNNNNNEKEDKGSWLFSEVRSDVRNRLKHYRSDITDGLTLAILPAILYMFCVTVVPTLTFGAIMAIGTGGLLAVKECLISQALSGLIWTVFSCQPLLVMSPTGPFLVFEKALYQFCTSLSLDFMEVRLYTGFFVFLLTIFGAGTNCARLIKHVTIYTEDVFCALISMIFFAEVYEFMEHQFNINPIEDIKYYIDITRNCTSPLPDDCKMALPNAFLVQFCMVFISVAIFHFSRKIGKSSLFGSTFRNLCENFGGIFAVIATSAYYLFRLSFVKVSMVEIPSTFGDNRLDYGYFVIPKTLPTIPTLLLAMFAACLVFVLIFVETEIPEQMALRDKRKLKKGGGYHWDLIVVGFTTQISSIVGLPWMCPAAVQSLAHITSVTEYHKCKPSELKKIKNVREQRVSGFVTYVLLALFACFGHYCAIPSASVFGVFFYLGVRNLDGSLLLSRCQMIFTANKYRDKYKFLQDLPIITVQGFTFCQILLLIALFALKQTLIGSLCFPLFLVATVFLRKYVLTWMHGHEAVDLLDKEIESSWNEEDAEDFYGDSRIPV